MKINRFRVLNYKGFQDSGWISFGSGMNVIVGQNNSGKTALLEALRLRNCESRPYRGLKNSPGATLNPKSSYELDLSISGPELRQMALRHGIDDWVPIPRNEDPNAFIKRLFSTNELVMRARCGHNDQTISISYPSHQLFTDASSPSSVKIGPSNDRQSFEITSQSSGTPDTLLSVLDRGHTESIYVFKPERIGLGTSGVEDTEVLQPNASNLPAVLLKLQGNPTRYSRFNDHVREIFPTVRHIAVVPFQNQLSIRVWSVDLDTERDDLQVRLEESGTGIGQVLAILYVAMTRRANVIAIDEPNSFLHPGAAKKLIEILNLYDQNQYIVSTHSAELITAANPSTLNRVYWNGAESAVEQLDRDSIHNMRRILSDVGVSLSDVFGADKVIWVEGETEQECFPKIARQMLPGSPRGIAFVALRNTGDLEAKGASAEAIWEIYERLTKGPGLLPATLAFSFDTENRSSKSIKDMKRRSHGRAHFLPRATFENYLLDVEAIFAVMSSEFSNFDINLTIAASQISDWIDTNGLKYSPEKLPTSDSKWLLSCDAPRLLIDLFQDLSKAMLQYHKLTHSIALTEWILGHRQELFEGLAAYIASLIEAKELQR
jgi:predicted ATPase